MTKGIVDTLSRARIIPVISGATTTNILPLTEAMLKGGIGVLELTLRSPGALEALELVSKKFPELMIGAGTVLSTISCDNAMDAGASFVVSPAFVPSTVDYCITKKYPIIPGISNPDGAANATIRGLQLVKLFPATLLGGLEMVDALGGPFPDLKFMATGGINEGNVLDWLRHPAILAVGGTWLAREATIVQNDWSAITDACSTAMDLVHGMT